MNVENLRALVYGHDLSVYQKILAQREFEAMEKQALNTGVVGVCAFDCECSCGWKGNESDLVVDYYDAFNMSNSVATCCPVCGEELD